jgi:hypothetical protein
MPYRMESRAAENRLFESSVGISAHDQKVGLDFLRRAEERMADLLLGSWDDPSLSIEVMTRKVFDKSLWISGISVMLLD